MMAMQLSEAARVLDAVLADPALRARISTAMPMLMQRESRVPLPPQ